MLLHGDTQPIHRKMHCRQRHMILHRVDECLFQPSKRPTEHDFLFGNEVDGLWGVCNQAHMCRFFSYAKNLCGYPSSSPSLRTT